jgi:hypothetical protein
MLKYSWINNRPLGSRRVETATMRAGVEKNQWAMAATNPTQRKNSKFNNL